MLVNAPGFMSKAAARWLGCVFITLSCLLMSIAPAVADLIIDTSGGDGGTPAYYNGAAGSVTLSSSPNWVVENPGEDEGYNTSRQWFSEIGGGAGQTAVWTFTGLGAGDYSVHSFHSAFANRTTAAPFEIFDGTVSGTLVSSSTVNQRIAPGDLTIDDGQGLHTWAELSDMVTINSGSLSVRLTSVSNGGNTNFVMADAIRVATLSSAVPEPTTVLSLLGLVGVAFFRRKRRKLA